MLHEYAVEPRAIGSNWETFRYVIEKFGFDKGRLISQFPKHWFREVHEATHGLRPVEKLKVVEALNWAKKTKVVRFGRLYDPTAGNWLHNALAEHRREPFRAIIALQNPGGSDAVLLPDDLDELHPRMAVPNDREIPRDAASLAAALNGLLRCGSHIAFVDPFFDPYSVRYKRTLRECLGVVKRLNPAAICEVHYRYHDNKPSQVDLEREAAMLFRDIIPTGMAVTIFCWRERAGGADFHARYLLTDRGGIGVDAGFSAEGAHQSTDMHLMSLQLAETRLRSFARSAVDYELMGPVLRISANGTVERL